MCHGIIQVAQLVHKADVQALLACPHAALGNQLHAVLSHAAAVGHTLCEEVIATVYHLLHLGALGLVEGACHGANVRHLVGLHHVKLQAYLLGHQFAHVGNHAEDANGTGQCGRFGKDTVGGTTDVVSATGCHAAHAHHHGFLLLQQAHLAPDLFAGKGTATGAVHADYHGLHVIVLAQVLKVLYHLLAHYLVFLAHAEAGALALHDLAVGIVDGHLLVHLLVQCLALCHISHGSEYQVVILVLKTALLAQDGLHLVHVAEFVHQTSVQSHGSLGNHCQRIGQRVQFAHLHIAALGHVLQHVCPDAKEVGGNLLAVGRRHLGADEGLHGTLVCTHLEDLHLHANLLHHVLIEHNLRSHAAEVHVALGVKQYGVGHGRQVVGRLAIRVAIGNHPLSALLELHKGLAQFLCHTGVGTHGTALQIYADDVLVLGGLVQCQQGILQRQGRVFFTHESGEGIGIAALCQSAGKVQAQDALFLDGGAHALRCHHSGQRDDADDGEQRHGQEYTHHGCHCVLDETFHSV